MGCGKGIKWKKFLKSYLFIPYQLKIKANPRAKTAKKKHKKEAQNTYKTSAPGKSKNKQKVTGYLDS
jgi:hypothetical protein